MNLSLRHFLRTTLPAFASLVALCGSLQAAVLYSQSPVDEGDALLAQYSRSGGSGFQNADSFALGSAALITGVRFWGTGVADLDLFFVRLFDDLPSSSGNGVELSVGGRTSAATTLTDAVGNVIFEYELTLSGPLAVSAGSRYLSVFFDSTDDWGWLEGSGPDNVSAFRGQDDTPWDFLPPDLSFELLGERAIPEPTALALMLIAGTAGVGARRRAGRRPVLAPLPR